VKRITRTIRNLTREEPERVWLDQYGHWTKDEALAFEFSDDEASRRIKRIPHATLDEKKQQENVDADAPKE
jgi:hypothetical protein